MAKRVRIKWNMKAFQEIRRMPTVDAMLQGVVDDIEQQVSGVEGYKADVGSGRTRSRGTVWTSDMDSILDNEENDTLLRALANVRVG